MELTVPIRLVLDISTLSATTTREWLGFSRSGECYVPHVVYEEMRFLYDRSPDPDLERVAREFNRFYANSGWKISDAVGHHPWLKASTAQGMTKRTRVALAVARCAYGEAQTNPRHLVVLVTSDRAILQRMYDFQMSNLTGIPSASLLQWSRSGERPVAVTQKLQQLKDMNSSISGFATQPYRPTTAIPTHIHSSRTKKTGRLSSTRRQMPTRIQSKQTHVQAYRSKGRSRRTNTKVTPHVETMPLWVPQLMSFLSAFAALAVAGGIIWVLFFTSYLDRFLPKDETAPAALSSQSMIL